MGLAEIVLITALAGQPGVPFYPTFKGHEHQRHDDHDQIIKKECAYWNSYFGKRIPNYKPVNPEELIKMMALKEGGNYAWNYDPMQISNKGDTALTELKKGTLRLLDQKTRKWLKDQFANVDHARFYKKMWHYENTGITPLLSIRGGIVYLIAEKAAIYNSNKQCTGMRQWQEAVRRYNGGGDPEYLAKIYGMQTVDGKTYTHLLPKKQQAKNLPKPRARNIVIKRRK